MYYVLRTKSFGVGDTVNCFMCESIFRRSILVHREDVGSFRYSVLEK